MPTPNTAALEFLQTRRSRPAKTLTTPVPTRAQLMPLLNTAARCPDHGKLEPWRFIVLERTALRRLSALVATRGDALGHDAAKITKSQNQFATGDLAVAVIEVQKPSEKVPAIEQTYSAGAVAYGLLTTALAAGWGASWLSDWPAHDADFKKTALGLADNERVVGFVHIGTETRRPPERPRPDIEAITTWHSN